MAWRATFASGGLYKKQAVELIETGALEGHESDQLLVKQEQTRTHSLSNTQHYSNERERERLPVAVFFS